MDDSIDVKTEDESGDTEQNQPEEQAKDAGDVSRIEKGQTKMEDKEKEYQLPKKDSKYDTVADMKGAWRVVWSGG